MKTLLAIAAVLCLSGCDIPDRSPKTNPKVANQTVGAYVFTYVGTLDENTGFERLVWEVTGPDGQKFLVIRGYGVSEISTEKRGKTHVSVER